LSSNTNIGNTPVNQGYVQLIHTGETGGIDGTLRTLYDGDGTASDLQIASNAVKISTQLYIGSKTITEYVQDVVGDMFDTNGSHTNITATYDDDGDGAIDLVATGAISGITGGTGIDATGSGNITIAIDSTVATKTYVDTEVAGLVDSAPGTLDTLNELAAALGDDPNFATTTATNIATKLAKASNLSDLTNAETARTNLGLGTGAILDTAAVSDGATTLATGNAIYDHVTTRISGKVDNTRQILTISGSGLSGGGDLTANRSLSLDVNNLEGQVSALELADKVAIYDNSAGGTNVATLTQLKAIVNTDTNQLTTFNVSGDSGTDQTISHGNTLTISGGNGITTSTSATDIVSVALGGFADLTLESSPAEQDLLVLEDEIDGTIKKVKVDTLTSTDVTLAGTLDYITLSGQTITRNAIDLTTDVTGVLPIGNIDSSVVTLTGSQTLTNKTLASPTFTGDIDFSDSSTPQLNITDTTNTVTTRIQSQDSSGTVGTTTAHNFGINRNSVSHFLLFGQYTMHNSGGNDIDFRAKDSSGNVVFKVDAGTSKTEISTLLLDSVSISAIQSSGESFANNDTSLMTSAAVEDKILSYGYITEVGINEILAADIQTSSELVSPGFSDDDDSLMTAAAINDRIESFGYGTGTMSSWTLEGDSGSTTVTNANTVDIAGGTGITTVASLDAGRDTVTINFSAGIDDLSDVTINSGTLANGQVLKYSSAESAFVNQDEDTGISFNGSTANGLLTYGNSTTADVESNLTFDGDFKVTGTGGSTFETVGFDGSNGYLLLSGTASQRMEFRNTTTNANGWIGIPSWNTDAFYAYLPTASGNELAYIYESSRHNLYNDVALQATKKLYLDGGNGTYVHELSDNVIEFRTDNNPQLKIDNNAGVIINDGSYSSFDFRVESNNNTHMLFVDSGNDRVGIGVSSPADKLHIEGTTSSTRMRVKTTTGSAEARLITNNGDWILSSSGSSNQFQIYNATTSSTYFAIDSNGDVGIGGATTSFKLDVQGGSARISSGGLGVGVNPSGTTGRGDFSNDVIAYSTSDKRLKENIKPLDSALDKVLKISGVEFDWKELSEKEKKTIHGNEGHDVGVIAQEIEEVLPEVVTTRDSGYKAVKYEKIVPLLIEAIKEQQKQIEELKNG